MTVAVSLLKNILTPLGITAGATAIDAGIQNKKQKKTRFWDNSFINLKRKNEWHNNNCSRS